MSIVRQTCEMSKHRQATRKTQILQGSNNQTIPRDDPGLSPHPTAAIIKMPPFRCSWTKGVSGGRFRQRACRMHRLTHGALCKLMGKQPDSSRTETRKCGQTDKRHGQTARKGIGSQVSLIPTTTNACMHVRTHARMPSHMRTHTQIHTKTHR